MTTSYLDRPDGRIAFDDTSGGGPLVVLLPGMGDRRATYRYLTPLLTGAGYRVVTMDLRGMGESTTGWPDYSRAAVGSDLVALLDHLDAGPAVLVGNSYSAGGIVRAAAERPDRVAGIVPLDGFFRAMELGRLVRLGARVMARFPRLWSMYYRSLFATAKPADLTAYRAGLVTMLRDPARRAALREMFLLPDNHAERWVPDVRCPVLVVMGTKDPDFSDPAAEARLQAELLHGGDVAMIDGAGHYPYAEYPQRTFDALRPFLKETLGA